MIVQHKQYNCKVVWGEYGNGNTTIQLYGAEGTEYEHELIAVPTVNGEFELVDDVVGIKTWSENKGIVHSLINGEVIEPELLGTESTGFVAIEFYKLTQAAIKALKNS